MIIVIDGPSGAGKSTLAKKLAKALNVAFFDTGAMYRSFCWFLLNHQMDVNDQKSVVKALESFHFRMECHGDQGRFFVNDVDVSDLIRQPEIDQHVSIVSSYLPVREKMVDYQKKYAKRHSAIFEGRDMGTVVFPQADMKFFLMADAHIRAKRRYLQLLELNPGQSFELQQIESEIKRRDEYDSKRVHSPLKKAEDAIVIDASHLNIDEVFSQMKNQIEALKHEG